MNIRLSVLTKHGLLVLAMLMSMLAPIAYGQSAAAATNKDKGNNGTLKVHEFGTPSGTESNDPKVCAFNFEGFSFDSNQSGYINIDPQGGSSPVGVAAGPFVFGPTDAAGYAQSQYFNTAGGSTVVNGTYKATLYGKDSGGNINLTDTKAKSKVLKVECTPAPTDVVAADVVFVDVCSTADDTYTIPATAGVLYQISGATVAAGAYAGSGTVTVNAVADTSYSLIGTTSWQHTFGDVACPLVPVTPADPTSTDLACTSDGSYTVPQTTGVIYKVNGVVAVAGTYPVSVAGSVTVTAEADAGYQLAGQVSSWTLDFHDPTDCEPPVVDVCPNLIDVQTQVPTGMVVDSNGNCVTPGMGGGPNDDTTDTAVTPPVVVTSSAPVVAKQLVDTGTGAMLNVFAGLFFVASAAGLSVASYRRRSQV